MTIREIAEGQLEQGVDEQIAYTLTTTNWGSDPSSPVVKAYDITENLNTDVSSTVLSGDPAVDGDVITLPVLKSLTAGKIYRLEIKFTAAGNIFEAYAIVHAEI